MTQIALTRIMDMDHGEPSEVCVISRSSDGHPAHHGALLMEFLDGIQIIGDYQKEPPPRSVRSASFLVMQLISDFHLREPGRLELLPAGTRDREAAYIYTIRVRRHRPLHLTLAIKLARGGRKNLYRGPLSEFNPEERGYADPDT